jgi:phosphoglycolate phosphatase-like HAD superfamily hydrolase
LLHRLRDDGIKLVVATSAGGDEVEGLLEQAGVEDLIQAATSSSDAEESKPDPDIVEAALEQAGFPPDQVVMLGDTPYDVEAATRAGIAIVAVRTGGWEDADLRGAVAVYDDPAALLEAFDESPLGRGNGVTG